MSSFQSKNLSDEDIARLLDVCANTELRLRRESADAQTWYCPTCGLELRLDGVRTSMQIAHVRAEYAHAWIA